jgi:hypothetical protein
MLLMRYAKTNSIQARLRTFAVAGLMAIGLAVATDRVGLRVTKPGKHPINGLFRVGYIHGTDEIAMVSLHLIATVTGTE